MWLDPSSSGLIIVCRHPWLPDIIVALVSDTNPEGKLTNSNLGLADLLLHESTLMGSFIEEIMDVS